MNKLRRDFFLFIIYIFIFIGTGVIFSPSIDVKNEIKPVLDQIEPEIVLPAQLVNDLVKEDKTHIVDLKYINSIKYGTLWFYNNQSSSFLNYEYDIEKDVYAQEVEELRIIASMWAIAKAGNFTDISAFKNLGYKGLGYFEKSIKENKANDFYYINIPKGNPNIGYSAFMIMSLLEMEHEKKDLYLEKLANGIIYQQQSDGSLKTHFYSDNKNNIDYYPGEALIAIAKLYEYKPDEKYLEVLKKAFVYYKKYFRDNINTPFIPWQSRAYAKLYNFTKDQEVADFVFEMNDYLINTQAKKKECSEFVFNQGIIIAVRMEGMNQAYDVAIKTGDLKRAQCYANYVKEGADYIISLQTKKDIGVNKRAIGGFLQNENINSHRVDRNQHAIMALMEAVELGILK